jgi:DNA topoisomerase-1
MRFQQEVAVDPQVFKNIKLFKKEPKTVGDELFDRLNVSHQLPAVEFGS